MNNFGLKAGYLDEVVHSKRKTSTLRKRYSLFVIN